MRIFLPMFVITMVGVCSIWLEILKEAANLIDIKQKIQWKSDSDENGKTGRSEKHTSTSNSHL